MAKDYNSYAIGGKMYYFPKTQKGVAGNILNSAIEGGWSKQNIASAIAKNGDGSKTLSLVQNTLGGTFPSADGSLTLDDRAVVMAINNLLKLKGKDGVDDDAIDKIAKDLEENLTKACGALSQNLVGAYTGGGENEDDDREELGNF